MTELEKWFADPANPRELEEALNSPLVARALNMLVMMNLPSGFTRGEDMVTQASHNWHFFSGFHDFPKKLRMLAVSPDGTDTEPLEAFDPEWLKEWSEKRQANKTEV